MSLSSSLVPALTQPKAWTTALNMGSCASLKIRDHPVQKIQRLSRTDALRDLILKVTSFRFLNFGRWERQISAQKILISQLF